MAVINQADDTLTHPAENTSAGDRVRKLVKPISIAAADDNGSKYLIAELPDSAKIDELKIEGAVITAGTDYDIGLFDEDGNEINGDVFADGLDMSDATGLGTGPYGEAIRSGLTALAVADANKPLWELAGHVNKPFPAVGETKKKSKYRIVMTANTVGTAAGSLLVTIEYRVDF